MTEYDNYSLQPDETTAAPVPDAGEEWEPLGDTCAFPGCHRAAEAAYCGQCASAMGGGSE